MSSNGTWRRYGYNKKPVDSFKGEVDEYHQQPGLRQSAEITHGSTIVKNGKKLYEKR